MKKNEIIAEITQLLFREPIDYALLHTDDSGIFNVSDKSIEIDIYESAENDCSALENRICSLIENFSIKINKLNHLSNYRKYEAIMYGQLLFVKNRTAYIDQKHILMLDYLDFQPAYRQIIDHKIGKMKGSI